MSVPWQVCVKVRENCPRVSSLLWPCGDLGIKLWWSGLMTNNFTHIPAIQPKVSPLIPVFLGCHVIIFWLTEFLRKNYHHTCFSSKIFLIIIVFLFSFNQLGIVYFPTLFSLCIFPLNEDY